MSRTSEGEELRNLRREVWDKCIPLGLKYPNHEVHGFGCSVDTDTPAIKQEDIKNYQFLLDTTVDLVVKYLNNKKGG